jgi:hypothetical protein
MKNFKHFFIIGYNLIHNILPDIYFMLLMGSNINKQTIDTFSFRLEFHKSS